MRYEIMDAIIFPSLYGNEPIKNSIGKDILLDTNAHAYILEGPKGSGKHLAARLIASSLLCSNKNKSGILPCGECLSCKKIAKNLSPDLIWINSEGKATISVDIIRNVRNGLHIPPNDGDKKIYIIEDADTMTLQAQNAFLLSLPIRYFLCLLLVFHIEIWYT